MPTKSTGTIPAAVTPVLTIADPGLVKTQVKTVPVINPVQPMEKGRVSGMAGE